MRRRAAMIAGVVIGVSGAGLAGACTCVPVDAPTLLEKVPIVFVAEVVDVGPESLATFGGETARGSRIVLGGIESFKGRAPRELFQAGREFSCHPELKKGSRALFLLARQEQVIALCNTVQGREDLVSELRRAAGAARERLPARE